MNEHALPALTWSKTEYGITRLPRPNGELLTVVTLRQLLLHSTGPKTGQLDATAWFATGPAELRQIAAQLLALADTADGIQTAAPDVH